MKSIRVNNLLLLGLGQFFSWFFLVQEPTTIQEIYESKILIIIASTLLIAAGGYLINDYHDIKIDLINKPKSVIVGNRFSKKTALIFYWSITGAGVFISVLASIRLLGINIIASILLWFYSTTFKRHPYWGNITVSFLAFLSIFLLLIQFGWNHPLIYWYSAITFTLMMLREIIKDLEDVEGDQKEGYRTIPIHFGLRYTKSVLILIGSLTILELLALGLFINEVQMWAILGLISALVLYLLILIPQADTKLEFGRLSLISKFIFAAGIISIIFVK